MGAFEYQALDREQQRRRGVVQADSARQARSVLREEGLIPLDVKPVRTTSPKGFGWGVSKERVLIFRQLATLLRAGMTLEEVLTVLTEQADRASTRNVLGAIRSKVLEGHALSTAMSEHPNLFPRLYWSSVAAGERTGQLSDVLRRLADYAHQREAMGRGVGLALVYPALLLLIALLVVAGLVGFVVPRIINVFDQASQTLPWVTRSLLVLADGLAQYGWLALTVFVVLSLAGYVAFRRPNLRLRLDQSMLNWLLLGRFLRAQQTALLARTLAILIGSAVPLVEALKVCAQVLSNGQARSDIDSVAKAVSEGVSLSQSLKTVHWLSGVSKRLIHAGEKSGELASMLDQAADIEERSLASAQTVVLSVIQPVMILLVGLVVVYIVMAIMLPILNMSQLLGGP